jgi:hypothetical protein
MLSEDLSELLSAYLDGELPARQRKAVDRLLDESAEARELLRKLEGDAFLLRQSPPARVPFDLAPTILASLPACDTPRPRLHIPAETQPANRPLPWKKYTAVAALLIAVAGIAHWYTDRAGEGTPEVAVRPTTPDLGSGQGTSAVVPEADPAVRPEVPHRPGSRSVFAFPSRKATELSPAHARIPLIQRIGEVDQPLLLDHLQRSVADHACHIDLFCADPSKALEQLGLVCGNQGIRINVDPAAVRRLESPTPGPLAFYVENVTPREAALLLGELGAEPRSAKEFSALVVNAGPVVEEDLARVLGGPAKDFAPPSQRPLEQNTAGQLVHSLPGQGRDRGEPMPHRLAVVVPHEPPDGERCSEVQSLLDDYREARPGSMALLIVLWPRP